MKVAFLILAHDQPDHLAKLVKRLSSDWARVFIHIDGKVDVTPFQERIPEENGKVVFLGDEYREAVNWSGFSTVSATLRLLQSSLEGRERFDRFCLLSGSDFPTRSLNHIYDGFSSQKEFIRIDRRLDASDDNDHCYNVRHYHFMDGPCLGKAAHGDIREVYSDISLYHGSQWWSLTDKCVNHVMDFVGRNLDYSEFHKYTHCPDEIFFHSIVKSSPFSANITHDFELVDDLESFYALNQHGCHYVDWTSEGVPLPKVLDETDLNNLLSSQAYFARKFREGQSDKLLEALQRVV